ncbi:hypothetical protein KUTeg_004975 [Tegillarca granosa]|uniref:WD repeat-containing protein 34 n=1 Tax=Tegillarca granosa TaxID=220873 RepID=A0ABQ9FK88_TEGGR|nr:hypothetical protein KUTeg_004975 [Tegillarca granosa]
MSVCVSCKQHHQRPLTTESKMFTDETLEGVNFPSTWKKERSVSECGTQTRDLETDEVGVQSVKHREAEVQTDEEGGGKLRLAQDTTGRLGEWLRNIEPLIMKELERNLSSHAFDGYRYDHEDWCTHKTALCTWNLERRNLNENKPDTTIDLSSCLMCIAFHPDNPAQIAGGNFNGDVMLWDLSREDDLLLATSGIGDDGHREPVSKIYWVPDTSSKRKKFLLVSVCSDGKILIWKLDKKKHILQVVDGFVLMAQSLPRHLKSKNMRSDKEVGVTCISYNCEDKDVFVVGSEPGAVFKCSMHAQGEPAGGHIVSSVPLRSPVTFPYTSHHGPAQPVLTIEPGEGYVFSVKWSPVRPSLFAAATESGNVLFYDLKNNQSVPLKKLEANDKKIPVYTCQFNPSQFQLLATGDGEGYISIYRLSDDLKTSTSKETDVLSGLVNISTD